MKLLALLAFLALAPLARAAEPVPAARASERAGQTITVEGVVAEVFISRSANVFLNFDAPFPRNRFAAVILQDRGGMPLLAEGTAWLHALRGKTVRVTGPIVLYHGRAQVHLTDRAQITTR